MDLSESELGNIVEKLKKEIVKICEIGIPLRRLIKLIEQHHSAINLCYAYLPEEKSLRKEIDKKQFYQFLNRSIVLYTNETIDKVLKNLYSIVNNFNISEGRCQCIIRIEYEETTAKYLILVASNNVRVLSPNSLNSFSNIIDAIDNLSIDIISNKNIDRISSIKIIYPIDGEEIKLKFLCRFNKEMLHAILINSIVLCLLIRNL